MSVMPVRVLCAAVAAVCVGVLPALARQGGIPQGFAQEAKRIVDASVADPELPGMSVAVVFQGGETVRVAGGLARAAPHEQPMPTEAKMLSGSIGKLYCAVVVLQLIDEGVLSLDGLVSERLKDRAWFAGFPNAPALTVRSLLNHTSGVPEHVWDPRFHAALAADPQKSWTFDELLAISDGAGALFDVGEAWSYADTNYLVLGALVEEVTGQAYEDVLRARVLEPLGLDDTLTNEGPDLPGLVSGYTRLTGMFPGPEETAVDGVYAMNPSFEKTGGGVTSTATDLARFAHAVFTGDIVPEGLRASMLEGVSAPQLGPGAEYGLGVILTPTPQGTAMGHSGIMPGYLSEVRHYPELAGGVTIAVMVNTDRVAGQRGIARAMGGLSALIAGHAGG
ncbi:MAG: serine hydrolase domain-containing protein [Phycisphaerales bacterium JB040]